LIDKDFESGTVAQSLVLYLSRILREGLVMVGQIFVEEKTTMTARIATYMCLCLALSLSLSLPLRAQTSRGTVLGRVTDISGATVSGATVTLQNVNTGVAAKFTTNATGDYVFVNLIPGSYELKIEAPGFKTVRVPGLDVQVQQTLRQDTILEPGAVNQSVTVAADVEMLQGENAEIGGVVSRQLIDSLPLNGRDFTDLIAINAGVGQPVGGDQADSGGGSFAMHGLNNNYRSTSSNGARVDSLNYLIDGVLDIDYFWAKPTNYPSEFAIQEFKLQSGLYTADYGFGTTQVNVAIKSGTNQLHGNAYDFIRNAAFQPDDPRVKALNSLNGTNLPARAAFVQNQFGFSLGGPLVIPKLYNGRNRTFWFFNYEGARRSQGGGTQFLQVPTAAERSGNFADWPAQIFDPATTGSVPATASNPSGRTAFPSNTIPTGAFDPVAVKFLNFFPTPNVTCTLPCLNFQTTTVLRFTSNVETMRVDHSFSPHDQVFFTGNLTLFDQLLPDPVPIDSFQDKEFDQLYGLEWQHSFGSNKINQLRFGYNHENFHNGGITASGPNLSANVGFGSTTTFPAFYNLPLVRFGQNYSSVGTYSQGWSQKHNIYQYSDNLKLLVGKHTVSLGAEVRRAILGSTSGILQNGALNFNGSYTASDPVGARSGTLGPNFGNPLADFLLGAYTTILPVLPQPFFYWNLRGRPLGVFVQDDFRATPRLTLNFGLRYEIGPGFHSVTDSGRLPNLNYPGGGVIWANRHFTETNSVGVSPSVAATFLQCCVSNQINPTPKHDFAPRFGFAWRPSWSKKDKLVIRGGVGYFFDTLSYNFNFYDLNENSILTEASNPNYPQPTGSESAPPLPMKNLWLPPVTTNPFAAFAANPRGFQPFNFYMYPNNKDSNIQQWSLGTEYSINPSLLLDVSYVGSHGVHLPIRLFFNQAFLPKVAGDPCNVFVSRLLVPAGSPCLTDPNFVPTRERSPYPNLGNGAQSTTNNSPSNYHSLQVRATQRFSGGLTFLANYTYSHSLDEISQNGGGFVGEAISIPQDSHNQHGDYGSSSFDQRHRFVLSYSYDLPVGKGRRWDAGRVGNWIVGGWNSAGIVTFATGVPFSVAGANTAASDQTGVGFGQYLRANLVGNPATGGHTALQWFNTAAFAAPVAGTFGDSGRDILRAPGQRTADLSFGKVFKITDRHQLQYRLEIFNFLSSWHTGQVIPDNSVVDSPANCAPGPSGTCFFGSLVPLNGLGALNLWNPRIIQMSAIYSF
jgi:hypothetical protein